MTLDALHAFVMVTAAIALIVEDMSKVPSPVISPEMTRNGKATRMDKWIRLCCSLIQHVNTSRCARRELVHFSTLQVKDKHTYLVHSFLNFDIHQVLIWVIRGLATTKSCPSSCESMMILPWSPKMTSSLKRVATNLLGLLYLSPAKTIPFLL